MTVLDTVKTLLTSRKQLDEQVARIFQGNTGRGTPPRRGTRELLQAYSTMPWLRATTHKVATSISATDWLLFRPSNVEPIAGRRGLRRIQRANNPDVRRKRIKQRQGERTLEEVEEHPVLDLVDGGDDQGFLNGRSLWLITAAQFDLTGEAFWLKQRNGEGGEVEGYWPLSPSWIVETPRPGAANPVFLLRVDREEVPIPMSEVVWFRDPDVVDPYGRGVGVARTLADELDTDEYAAKHTKSWFYNSARPDFIGVIENVSENELRNLLMRWQSEHRGMFRSWLPRLMNRKIDIKEMSHTFRDMQLTDLRKHERDTVIQVYGISPEMLGILQNSNRATIESANFLFASSVLVPRIEIFRATLQTHIEMDFGPGLVLDYESPVPEDKEHMRQVYSTSPWAFMVDEHRELAGADPLEDDKGRVFPVPVSISFRAELTPTEQSEPAPIPDFLVDDDEEDEEEEEVPEDIDEVAAAASVEVLERHLTPVILETLVAFGKRILEDIGLDPDEFDVNSPSAIAYRSAISDQLSLINLTTQVELTKALDSTEESLAMQPVKSRVDKQSRRQSVNRVFDKATKTRSKNIARTETVSASNEGLVAAIRDATDTVDTEKVWVTMRDERVRDTHFAMDGLTIPLDSLFESPSGAQADHPGAFGVPEEDINCRCVLDFIVGGRALHDSEEKRAARWKQLDEEREPFEGALKSAAIAAFEEQRKAVLAALRLGGEA